MSTYYLPQTQSRDWVRANGRPMLNVQANATTFNSFLEKKEIPCIIVRNSETFQPCGLLLNEEDLQRWLREKDNGRWVAFYAVPIDKLLPLLPDYLQNYLRKALDKANERAA